MRSLRDGLDDLGHHFGAVFGNDVGEAAAATVLLRRVAGLAEVEGDGARAGPEHGVAHHALLSTHRPRTQAPVELPRHNAYVFYVPRSHGGTKLCRPIVRRPNGVLDLPGFTGAHPSLLV